MRNIRILIVTTVYLTLGTFLFPKVVYAYVDPGTGSYILQLIAGFIFGGLLGVKIYWKKIKSFVIKLFTKKPHAKRDT